MTTKEPTPQTMPITKDVLAWLEVSRPTLISWCRKYAVGGKPLGIKVGGRWKIYPARLKEFKDKGNQNEPGSQV